MTKDQKIIKGKVGLLELARQLGNVSQACKMLGYSHDTFYCFKELYDKGGELALQEISRKKPILANRTAPEIAARIVELAGHCRYVFFGFHPLRSMRKGISFRFGPIEISNLEPVSNMTCGRVAFLRPQTLLQGSPGESEIAESRALPHGYELALARRLVRGFAWAFRGAPRRFPRCARPGRSQRRRRGDGGFRRGAGGLSLLRRRSAGRMADRSDDGTTALAETSRDAAELHVDCERFPPVRAYILDQTATEPGLRHRATMVGADRRLYNGRGDQRRTRAGSNR
jgi:winged helix-turn helix protein